MLSLMREDYGSYNSVMYYSMNQNSQSVVSFFDRNHQS